MYSIFAYGTLKQGQSRAHFLQDQSLVGLARSDPDYRLFQVADYPGLVEVDRGAGMAIVGEVWLVSPDCLRRLDEEEGVSCGEYERRSIRICRDSLVPAGKITINFACIEAYFYRGPITDCRDCGPCWT